MNVEVSYSIKRVEFLSGMVVISMQRLQEAKGPVPERQILPVSSAQTEEEQVAQRMMLGAMQIVKSELGPLVHPCLDLTWEEYEKIGKPTVNDVLHITIEGKEHEG